MRQNNRERPDGMVSTAATNRDDSLGGRLRGRFPSSRYRRVVILGLVVCGLAAVPVVSAHAYLVASTPEDGAQLTDAPEKVTLRFSSKVLNANITVADLAGHRVDKGSVSRINETTFQVPLSDLDPGAYTVEWQIVSADGHQLSGSFTFVVVGNESSSSQSTTKTAAQPTTEKGTTPATTTTTPESTERPPRTATVTATVGSTMNKAATTQPTNGRAQTTASTGAGFDLAAAAGAGIVLVVTLLILRGWRE